MEKRDNEEVEVEEDLSSAWNPDDGIVLEWWGRAEGISDEQ